MEECLKTKFDQLISKDCKRHTALLISAAHIDIQADPLLHRACAIDLVTYCKDVPSGEGRRKNTYSFFAILFGFWDYISGHFLIVVFYEQNKNL